jgi:hypothetical protein
MTLQRFSTQIRDNSTRTYKPLQDFKMMGLIDLLLPFSSVLAMGQPVKGGYETL